MCYCLNDHDSAEAYLRSRTRRRVIGVILFLASALIVWLAVSLALAQDTIPIAASLPTNINMWTVVVGAVLPLLISAANRLPVPNYMIAFTLCVAAAFGDVYFSGRLNSADWATSLLTIFFTVVTTYQAFWKPSGITNKIEGKQ